MTEIEAQRQLDSIGELIRRQGQAIRELEAELASKVNIMRLQGNRIVELQQELANAREEPA